MTRMLGIVAGVLLSVPGMAYGQRTQESKFVSDMMLANMAEIEFGQIGEQRAADLEVRAFAGSVVADATQARDTLRPLARQLGVRRPPELDRHRRGVAAHLLELTGTAFDRAFIQAISDEQQHALRDARKMTGSAPAVVGTSGSARPAVTVRDYAAMTLPIVERDLSEAQQIARRLGK